MSYPWTWDPKRGDATGALATMFDFFFDANRLGYADAEDITAAAPPILSDETGANHHVWINTSSGATMNDPSVDFGTNNAGIEYATLGRIVVRENHITDTINDVPQFITPLLGRGDTGDPSACTIVQVAAYSAIGGFPFLTPYSYANSLDLDGHLFGATGGDWVTGSANDPAGSGTATDADPHLFIAESGTLTSGVEVDGVPGTLTDLTSAAVVFPDLWALVGTSEVLFTGILAGVLTDGQKQEIRDWVNNNVSTITVV